MTAPESDKAAIRQTIRALRAAGYGLASVYDREEDTEVTTETEALKLITDLDDAYLFVRRDGKRSWVRFVMGNDPDEVIADHTVDLSPVLDPLTDKWFE